MKAQSGWPLGGAPEKGMNYFRPGEVMVLMEPTAPPPDDDIAAKERDRGLQAALRALFEKIQHPIRDDAFIREGVSEARDRDLSPIGLSRRAIDRDGQVRGDRSLLLQTVTLVDAPDTETHDVTKIAPGIDSVIRAVAAINDPDQWSEEKGAIRELGFPIVAATPNWLAMPFHD